jgi:CBS domain-containing protein
MRVGEMCTRGVVCVSENAPLREAAVAMKERHVGAIVVVLAQTSKPAAVGIITDRDIVRAQLEHVADLSRVRVADVMTPLTFTLSVDESLPGAIELMRAHGVRRAPVVDSQQALFGFVSTDDLIAELARQLGTLGQLLARQPRNYNPRKHP